MHAIRPLLLSLFCGLVGPAALCMAPEAENAFAEGRYAAAIELSRSTDSADDAAFCARVLLTQAITDPAGPSPQRVQEGLDMANLALAAQPDHIEGRLQKAIALSLLTRPMSLGEARRSGYGDQARELAEGVLRDDPENVYAHGFLAVWNLEVLRRGGRIGALVMGADVKSAEQHYASAIAAAPDDAAVRWQFARALAALNPRKYNDEIAKALSAAMAAHVDSQLEAEMQARAITLSNKLALEGAQAAQDWAAETL